MSPLTRKFVAVLMLLWLPLFSTGALAASVSMQLQHGGCHEAAAMPLMSHEDMSEHQHHHAMAAADEQSPSHDTCGVCHLVCTGYLSVADVDMVAAQTAARETTPYLLSFVSFSSAPLDPPPLARI